MLQSTSVGLLGLRLRWPSASCVLGSCILWAWGCSEGAASNSDDPAPSSTPSDSSSSPEGSGGAPAPSMSSSAGFAYNRCPEAESVGGFSLVLAEDFTSFQGAVTDGVLPSSVPVLVQSEGACQLLESPNLTCEDCNVTTETCSSTGCIPFPATHAVGEVSVAGLKEPLTVTPSGRSRYTNPPGLEHPAFEYGADITLSAAGGDYGAFSLQGWGVAPLELSPEPIVLSQAQAAEVTWTAPTDPGPARIYAVLNVNHHGSASNWIACETEDTGRLEIPAALVSALIERGLSGWPTLEIRRQTADSTELEPGCDDFLVQAPRSVDVGVEGLTSCDTTEDCPQGEVCNNALRVCE